MTYRPATVSATAAGDLIELKFSSFVRDPPHSRHDQIKFRLFEII